MSNDTFFEDTHYEDQMRRYGQSGYYIDTRKLQACVVPGTIKVRERNEIGGRVKFKLNVGALDYTNDALIAWCGGDRNSRAVVTRHLDGVNVSLVCA